MKAEDVYRGVRVFVYNHDHKLQNVFVHSWEADSFSITASNYIYEVEVKVSRSDFFNDFNKPKHHFFKSYKKGNGIYKIGQSWRCERWPVTNKYPELKDFHIEYNNIQALTFNHKTCPNKFYFACPVGLIELHEIPEYAGLIYVMDSGQPREVKKAPYLHKDKAEPKDLLFEKYYWQNINQRQKIRELESTIKHLKQKQAV